MHKSDSSANNSVGGLTLRYLCSSPGVKKKTETEIRFETNFRSIFQSCN
jgi:hypothetical protein